MSDKKRVAIIEDDAPTRELLQSVLEHKGCEVISGSNGMDVVKNLGTKKPDLILLDLNLPGLNGDEVIAVFKEQGLVDGVPIVIISGEKEGTIEAAAEKTDAMIRIRKPFKIETVMSVIGQYIT